MYSGPKLSYNNWEIAVLVNVIHQREEDGNVTRIVLDLSSKSPMFMIHHL